MNQLPQELVTLILLFGTGSCADHKRLRGTCKLFNRAAQDEDLWAQLYSRYVTNGSQTFVVKKFEHPSVEQCTFKDWCQECIPAIEKSSLPPTLIFH